jgi:hypothetical protein
MTLKINLTPEQGDILQQAAASPSSSRQTVLRDLTITLPDGQVMTVDVKTKPKTTARRKTPAEMVAAWKASGLPSVYARDPRDATAIARELRARAERRDWSEG